MQKPQKVTVTLSDKLITHTPNGQNTLWVIRVGFEFLAQPADVDMYHLRLSDEFRTPNLGQQVFGGKHLVGFSSQRQ